MRKSCGTSTKVGGNATDVGGIDFRRCAREWRAIWSIKTAENVAAFYGCPIRTAENWLAGASVPNGYWSGIIFNRSGAEFLAKVLIDPDEWIVEAARAAKRSRLDRELAAIEAEIAAEVAA